MYTAPSDSDSRRGESCFPGSRQSGENDEHLSPVFGGAPPINFAELRRVRFEAILAKSRRDRY